METENKNGSMSNHPSSADDAASIVGPCDNLVNTSDCSWDSKAVGSKMVDPRASYQCHQFKRVLREAFQWRLLRPSDKYGIQQRN